MSANKATLAKIEKMVTKELAFQVNRLNRLNGRIHELEKISMLRNVGEVDSGEVREELSTLKTKIKQAEKWIKMLNEILSIIRG